jgi:hypothetical protein
MQASTPKPSLCSGARPPFSTPPAVIMREGAVHGVRLSSYHSPHLQWFLPFDSTRMWVRGKVSNRPAQSPLLAMTRIESSPHKTMALHTLPSLDLVERNRAHAHNNCVALVFVCWSTIARNHSLSEELSYCAPRLDVPHSSPHLHHLPLCRLMKPALSSPCAHACSHDATVAPP